MVMYCRLHVGQQQTKSVNREEWAESVALLEQIANSSTGMHQPLCGEGWACKGVPMGSWCFMLECSRLVAGPGLYLITGGQGPSLDIDGVHFGQGWPLKREQYVQRVAAQVSN